MCPERAKQTVIYGLGKVLFNHGAQWFAALNGCDWLTPLLGQTAFGCLRREVGLSDGPAAEPKSLDWLCWGGGGVPSNRRLPQLPALFKNTA